MKKKLFLTTAFLTICINLLFAQDAKLLLHNVNIINVVDGSTKKNAAIVMEGGNILAIGEY